MTKPMLPASRVNDDLLRFVLAPHAPRWFWVTVVICGGILLAWAVTLGGLVLDGLQLLGLTDNVYWAIFITNFIFGVGMSHAGVMISAILRLTQAEWRFFRTEILMSYIFRPSLNISY